MNHPHPKTHIAGALLMTLLMAGCDSHDERLTRLAVEHSRQQAEQNRHMARMQEELSASTRELVAADAQSRRELIEFQRELQSEQARVGTQRDRLESDRRALASQRQTDPIIAAALLNIGLTLACVLPLVLCWYLLRPSQDAGVDQVLSELLINDLVSPNPLLLPPPTNLRIGHQEDPAMDPPLADQPRSLPDE